MPRVFRTGSRTRSLTSSMVSCECCCWKINASKKSALFFEGPGTGCAEDSVPSEIILHEEKPLMKAALLPIQHPIIFSRPRRIVSSGWIQHTPFAFFLMDLFRPRLFVELGSFSGASYCA